MSEVSDKPTQHLSEGWGFRTEKVQTDNSDLHDTDCGQIAQVFRDVGIKHEVTVSRTGYFTIEIFGNHETEPDCGIAFSTDGKFLEAVKRS